MFKRPTEANWQALAPTLDLYSDETDNIDSILYIALTQRVQAQSQPSAPKQKVQKETDNDDHSYRVNTRWDHHYLHKNFIHKIEHKVCQQNERRRFEGTGKVLKHKQSESACYKYQDTSKHPV